MTKQLILGGARSGKSTLAETRTKATDKRLIYIATGSAGDAEMATRIEHHQARRGEEWLLIEEQTQLAKVLLENDSSSNCILVDCLTLWLSNCLHQSCWQQQQQALLDTFALLQSDILLVSNEVGSGIVPMGELSRQFADEAGRLHQSLARLCDHVVLVVAGLPLTLK